jgi:hypothetical protein
MPNPFLEQHALPLPAPTITNVTIGTAIEEFPFSYIQALRRANSIIISLKQDLEIGSFFVDYFKQQVIKRGVQSITLSLRLWIKWEH